MQEPLIASVTLSSSANTASTLYSLLGAISPAIAGLRKVCCELTMQTDASGGAAKFAVGGSGAAVTTGTAGTGSGMQLTAGATFTLGPFSSNLIHLDEIYLASDTVSALVNVAIVTR